MLKYKLTKEKKKFLGKTLYRIEALKDFGNVKKGHLGGFIESEENLSQKGNCWIYNNAIVCDNARVSDHGRAYDNSVVRDNARVFGNSVVSANSVIGNNVTVCGDVQVIGYVRLSANAELWGDTIVGGDTQEEDEEFPLPMQPNTIIKMADIEEKIEKREQKVLEVLKLMVNVNLQELSDQELSNLAKKIASNFEITLK